MPTGGMDPKRRSAEAARHIELRSLPARDWNVSEVGNLIAREIAVAHNSLSAEKTLRAGCTPSQLFPVGQRNQLVWNLLHSLKATLRSSARPLCSSCRLAHVGSICFTDLDDLLLATERLEVLGIDSGNYRTDSNGFTPIPFDH